MLILPPQRTLYKAWKALNEAFLDPEVDASGMMIPNRDFSRVIPYVRMESTGGFGLPKKKPPFFAHYDRRTAMLANRYIEPELWQEGILRLHNRNCRLARLNPLSFVMAFHRRPTKERKVPAGGGCLQTITFIWIHNKWDLHVHLRASEITARLLADIVFIKWTVQQVLKEVPLKNWDWKNLRIVWDIDLASQMKYMVPPFQLYTRGEEWVKKYYQSECPRGEWAKVIWTHFWDTFIWPGRISWMQRRRWSEKFLQDTKTVWKETPRGKAMWEKMVREHEERMKNR